MNSISHTVSSDFQVVDVPFLNDTLHRWVNEERFAAFPKVTRANIHQISQTKKYLVLAVVEENKLNEIVGLEMEFRDMVESIIRQNYETFHPNFQFGWIGSPDIAHSIVMSHLVTPHLIVLNSTTYEHYIPDDEPEQLTADAIKLFLHNIRHEKVKVGHKFASFFLFFCNPINTISTIEMKFFRSMAAIRSSSAFIERISRARVIYRTCGEEIQF